MQTRVPPRPSLSSTGTFSEQQGRLTLSMWQLVAASVILLIFYVGSALDARPDRDVWMTNTTAVHDHRQATQLGFPTPPPAEKRTRAFVW
jgi:hypothetical protein